MQQIRINETLHLPVDQRSVEIVERKGRGHPDTICDLLVEFISSRLSQAYLERFERVLHFNLDKALLVAGSSEPEFGGGRIVEPMKFILGDRATSRLGDQTLELAPIIDAGVNDWFKTNLDSVDPAQHVIVQNEIHPGSTELAGIFSRDQIVANDTSAAVGYAPLSETERIVLATEDWLNSPKMKRKFPVIGHDIKLMAVRDDDRLGLTAAIAFVDRFVTSSSDYFEQKQIIQAEINHFVASQASQINQIDVQINTLDDLARGKSGMYLTVTGTSAECGDSGQVGRGNNVRGLISLSRPVANEAAAGKNPVSHVGKIYNLLSYAIADRIYESVDGVEEVYVWLVSQIGRPVGEPWLTSASLKLKPGALLRDVEEKVNDVITNELARISEFCDQLTWGKSNVC